MLITVDCGMTNMRLTLFDGKVPILEAKRKTGGRSYAATGSSDELFAALRSAIAELIERADLSEGDIEAVLCSGILASDVGIRYIPHATAPCGVAESARQAQLLSIKEITSIPILLIPGVKTAPDEGEADIFRILDRLESMSGEDCEIYGTMEALGLEGDFVIALPGSYNKTVSVDGSGRIASISTGMCGEMIAAMSEHTILKNTLPSPVIRKIIPELLTLGFDYARRWGMSPSVIKARTLVTMRGKSEDEAANFFIGALLVDDILSSVKQEKEGRPFLVGGSEPLNEIFCLLLSHAGAKNVVKLNETAAKLAPSLGAMKVYEKYKEINR